MCRLQGGTALPRQAAGRGATLAEATPMKLTRYAASDTRPSVPLLCRCRGARGRGKHLRAAEQCAAPAAGHCSAAPPAAEEEARPGRAAKQWHTSPCGNGGLYPVRPSLSRRLLCIGLALAGALSPAAAAP